MRVWKYLQETLDFPLNTETNKQTHKIMMKDEKGLVGVIESHLHFQAIIFLHQPAILKKGWKMQFLGSIKLKTMIQLWPLHICLETLSIFIQFKMEM